MLEKKIEEHLVQRIKAKGGIAYKFTSPQRRSVPDRLVLEPSTHMVQAMRELLVRYRVEDALSISNRVLEMDAQKLLAFGVKFVELKATGKKPTPLQEREHAFLRGLGFEVLVIDSKEEIDERWPK